MQKVEISKIGAAFLDGFSLAGFLGPLRRPGAPTQLFADPALETVANRVSDSGDPSTDLEKAKRLLVKAGFQVIPGTTARVGQR